MPRPQDESSSRRIPWYGWALVNLLALCFAVASWVIMTEIFGRPHVPHNYQILREMNLAPKFKDFSPQTAPSGQVFDPPQLYGWFFDIGDKGYAKLNNLYRRNFMRNFDDSHAITYVQGRFEVLATRPLGKGDLLPNGIAVRARALVRPDDFSAEAPYPVIVELMVPTANRAAESQFTTGARFSLSRTPHLPVVMHAGRYVERDESIVQVTLLPIGYGRIDTPSGMTIKLEVPEWVDPLGRLPLFELGSGMK